MIINKFEDIESWKEARILVKDIYAVFSDYKEYIRLQETKGKRLDQLTMFTDG